jgi:hypothetical protein
LNTDEGLIIDKFIPNLQKRSIPNCYLETKPSPDRNPTISQEIAMKSYL